MKSLVSKRNRAVAAAAGAALATALGGQACAGREPADLVLRHGVVVTVDKQDTIASALAVKGGRIVYVGDERGVSGYIGAGSKVIDLQGRMATPGLIDGHMHPLEGGEQLLACNLNYEALTVAQFRARIQACLDANRGKEPDALLEVVNWFQQNMLPSGAVVDLKALDDLKTRRPIAVRSSFGHSTLVNRRALELAKITAATPDPTAGKIQRDAKGDPNGILEDSAQDLIKSLVPPITAQDKVKAARAALDALCRQGVTSFLDADAGADGGDIPPFATLQKAGELTARAHFAPLVQPTDGGAPEKMARAIAALAAKYDQGALAPAPTITVRNAKLFMDGVITAPAFTGAMIEPYRVNKGSPEHPDWRTGADRGPPTYFSAQVLPPLLIALAKAGFDPHLHADGDRAVRVALDGARKLREALPNQDVRVAIAHDEIVDPADFPRFGRLAVQPVLSFQWAKPAVDTIDGARDYLGPERFKYMEPEGYLEAAGARIAFGSDWPVDPLDEWFALKVGVTRENDPSAGETYNGRLSTDPGLSRRTVLRAATINAAYELHQDEQTGSLEPGKFADVIVLDRNFFTIPSDDIAKIKVLMTVVGGRVVFDALGQK